MLSSKAAGRLISFSRNGRYLAASSRISVGRKLSSVNTRACRSFQEASKPSWLFMAPSRTYTTHATPPSETQPPPSETQPNPESQPDPEAGQWIAILENTTSAPWLFTLSPDPEQRLRIAYALLFQIVLYLTRPTEAEQFIVAFGTAPASSDSEIGRARKAVGTIIQAAVHQMSSVPSDAPVRAAHGDVFDIFGALHAIRDMYAAEDLSALKTWSEFWARAQPVILELGMKLDEKGFGLTEEDWNEMTAREEKAEKGKTE
ncbi:hypothetical protein LshimejAT787_0311900 [Lyophyllum shimeji]|uniref:Uncharacterized protein n=1 Tax=Lyophyllum shimeji TaxID=47721 RepID=A0A9P3PK22_LYOSH|nr:hypothetical protein LshimejAT787_0311900 [Lyophyllum shimeji]